MGHLRPHGSLNRARTEKPVAGTQGTALGSLRRPQQMIIVDKATHLSGKARAPTILKAGG